VGRAPLVADAYDEWPDPGAVAEKDAVEEVLGLHDGRRSAFCISWTDSVRLLRSRDGFPKAATWRLCGRECGLLKADWERSTISEGNPEPAGVLGVKVKNF
jgi:hypothetical protein